MPTPDNLPFAIWYNIIMGVISPVHRSRPYSTGKDYIRGRVIGNHLVCNSAYRISSQFLHIQHSSLNMWFMVWTIGGIYGNKTQTLMPTSLGWQIWHIQSLMTTSINSFFHLETHSLGKSSYICCKTILRVSCISAHLASRDLYYLCSRLSLKGYLQSKQSWKIEGVCLSRGKGMYAYQPV